MPFIGGNNNLMSQLDQSPSQDREELGKWKAPDTTTSQVPEKQTPQAMAERIIAGSQRNAAQTTEKEGKPGWRPYEDRLAVAERNWLQISMEGIKDPAVLEPLQQRMLEIDRQIPDMQDYLHGRANQENSSETWKASLERSKIEAAKLLEELPQLEAQLRQISPSDTVTILTSIIGKGEEQVNVSNHPEEAKAISNFLEKCKTLTVPGTAFKHTVRGDELRRNRVDSAGDLYGMSLMWTGQQTGNNNELRTNATQLIRMLREGLEAAAKLKIPYLQ